jgi:hypothetical protein
VADASERDAHGPQRPFPHAVLGAHNAEEQVLGPDVVVAELSCDLAGRRDGVSRIMAETLKHSEPPFVGCSATDVRPHGVRTYRFSA